MKSIAFKEQHIVIAKDQPQYGDLPAYDCHDECGTIITCWKGTTWERWKFLFTGKMWVNYLTFGNRIQPMKINTKYPFNE